jgi:peptidoglycan-associated lipoprotein
MDQMRRIELPLVLVGLAVVALSACPGSKPETTAQPQTSADSLNRARQDSINAALAADERHRREEAERLAAQRRADSLAALEKSAEEVRAGLAVMIHFDYDKATIRSEDAALLERKVPLLQANPGLRVRIAGHCDERGSDEYNLALGNRRALSAKQFLVDHGVDGNRLEIVSYGKERPLDPGHNEAAWAQNRRDEFEVMNPSVVLRKP